MKPFARRALMAALTASALACPRAATLPVPEPTATPVPKLELVPVELPAPAGARFPDVLVQGDQVWLSWLEAGENDEFRLQVSHGALGAFSEPVTIAHGARLLANWADFPALHVSADGTLYAHWLQKVEGSAYAYGIQLARSTDGGATWTDLGWAHDDGTKSEHGFVSTVPSPGQDDSVMMFWLDGRQTVDKGPMTLRTARVSDTVADSRVVDERVCDCCGTSTVVTDAGVLLAYRDRSEEEIRDIVVQRLDADTGEWQRIEVAPDHWEMPGCPVNGPALAANGKSVVLAWFTGAPEDIARVRVAFSTDGSSFGAPVEIAADTDDDQVLGQVDSVLVRPGSAYVTWLEFGSETRLRLRRVDADGSMGDPLTVAAVARGRKAGFPRMVEVGESLLLIWTTPDGIAAASARIPK